MVVGVGVGTNPQSELPSIILGLSQKDIQAEHMTAPFWKKAPPLQGLKLVNVSPTGIVKKND